MQVTEEKTISFTRSDDRISELLHILHSISDLDAASAVLAWDQATGGLPEGAGEVRAHQFATLEGLIHEQKTSARLGKLLDELERAVERSSFTDADSGLVRCVRHDYDQATKLPRSLIEEMGRTAVISYQAWVRARANNDFASFAPHLQRTIAFQRELADHLGYQENRYDALLDRLNPAITSRDLERLFAPIRDTSISLLRRIQDNTIKIDTSFMTGQFAQERQRALAEQLLRSIGYDFSRGVLAISPHPFTAGMGTPHDVRLTTRYSDFLPTSMMAALHEGGHALYEQGCDNALVRTPLARGTSSGFHESQSRLWENAIGRSEPFWQHHYQLVQEAFPYPFQQISVQAFSRALNHVQASLIRVEADEVSYNLHIIIRVELEQALLNGDIAVESLPRLWNEKYRSYLGIEPESDADGVLQDVHWAGGFGSFPGYTLGNLYSAQIYHALRQQFADFDERLSRGETTFILNWLREHIHRFGSIYRANELLQHVSGEDANPQYLVNYLTEKFSRLYGLL
ncbi:MAG TPA: carboxypeptidase M32 [Ktedonobacteraceae bacterium]|nr:carboxypeptidase M32 [Ktedonobacteraceae bacterium]